MRLLRLTALAAATMLSLGTAAPPAPIATVRYRSNGRMIFPRVLIQGTPLGFTVDTGARHIVIDAAAAPIRGTD